MESSVRFFTGSASKEVATKIAASYGSALGKVKLIRFSDGEIQFLLKKVCVGK